MKVVVFAPANNVHTKKWLDYYNEQGIETINISFDTHRDEEDRSNWEWVKTTYLKVKFPNKLAYFLTIPELKKILNTEKPDIFHSHYISSYGVMGALANYHPYVVSVWGTDIYDFPTKGILNKKMVSYALKKADVICSTSEAMKHETNKYTNKPIEVTPFGVDTNVFAPLNLNRNKDIIVFGIVKTMDESYGINYLLQGYARFKETVGPEKYKKTHLKIVGGGPLLSELKQLAQNLGIVEQTTFTGRIPHGEVPAVINEFDVFFVPSILESFGVAAVEAQACEVPVVVTDVGGLPEVMLDNETGFIIPMRDADSISQKMEFFMEHPEKISEMGKRGRENVMEHYSWQENANRMIKIYKRILEGEVDNIE
ncbi:glycosyltransferase [Lederbergia citri]|uniref:Glycosyltransferase n=1 Tax=Lederbergia citri TaxID=2833580 RepID=A0A942TDS6_9BACI|nr:glycosyltransferase [Lederbergia citri]MBS4195805.1 glycosyltransferase [Lederbergia citri]